MTTLGRYAFNYCNNLSEVVLADSVDSLRFECFGNCTSLTSIEFLGGNVEASVFSGCSGLKTASIPNVQALASTIFSGCTKLEQVTLPARVTDGRLVGLFYNCKALKEVKIPDGVTWVSADAFNNCNSLTHVTLSAETLLAIKTIDAGTDIDKISAIRKPILDTQKAAIRREDIKRGVFSYIADLPRQEPKRAAMQVRPTL